MDKFHNWQPPIKPGEITETRLIRAILDGTFPINSFLPGERDLAALLGVTRPTLREAMQRLERDGWLEIQQGKPTRVKDFWKEGRLGVSIALAQYQSPLPDDYVANLLTVRTLLAPAYTRSAVENAPDDISVFLKTAGQLGDNAEEFSDYDWKLHWLLTVHSGNSFFTHFINSVKRLYEIMGIPYFQVERARDHSRQFYRLLHECCDKKDGQAAGELSKRIMSESCDMWVKLISPNIKDNKLEEI